jgi:hypothetical protein
VNELSRWNPLRFGRAGKAFSSLVGIASIVGTLVALGVIAPVDENPLEVAADRTTEAGSSRVYLKRTIGDGSTTREEEATGELDYHAEAGWLTYVSGPAADAGVRILIRKPFVYELGLLPERVWCAYDLRTTAFSLFGVATGFSADPAEALVNLKESGTYQRIGEEELPGRRAVHYQGSVDLAKLRQRELDPHLAKLIGEFASAQGLSTFGVDVWVGPDDLVSRLKLTYGSLATLDWTFSHYGTQVAEEAPPSGEEIAVSGERGCPAEP